jgi:hypothetical protein
VKAVRDLASGTADVTDDVLARLRERFGRNGGTEDPAA